MKTEAELGGELNSLADGLLGFIFVCVVVHDPYAPLDIRDHLPVRLAEIVSDQAGYPSDIIAEALEDNGIGDLDQALPVPSQEAFLRVGSGQHPSQPQVGLGIIEYRAVFRETRKRKQCA